MKNTLSACIALPLAILLLAATPATAGSSVERRGDRLSVSFEDERLETVLEALRDQAQIEITVPDDASSRTVTVEFENRPMSRALAILFRDLQLESRAVVYEADGRIKIVAVESGEADPIPVEVPEDEPAIEPIMVNGVPYIPPAEPPQYVPETSEPLEVPLRTMPEYIPPASPPQYLPGPDPVEVTG